MVGHAVTLSGETRLNPARWRPYRTALLTPTARDRLQRIRREDALEEMDRTFVLEAYSRHESVCISKRHGVWDWDRDGIPGWLLPVLSDAGLLP